MAQGVEVTLREAHGLVRMSWDKEDAACGGLEEGATVGRRACSRLAVESSDDQTISLV